MSASSIDPGDLLDLKLMPAWVKEPSAREEYANYEGESTPVGGETRQSQRRGPRHGPGRKSGPSPQRVSKGQGRTQDNRRPGRQSQGRDLPRRDHPAPKPERPLDVSVHFLPRPAVLENVIAQVKAESLAYSLFYLARSFLEKPQRYEVALKAKPESPVYQLGEAGAVSVDQPFLENSAFRLAREDFYKAEVTQSEPLKGNFGSISRCRLSGTVLGPSSHHDYQRKLRNLYEQRFSRRMSFADYQRQIETVSDPAAVEQWKEAARNVTTFATLHEEPATTFPNATEAEHHFRQTYLPKIIRSIQEVVINGVTSRQMADRRLGRHIEQAWSVENGSPSHMMQELAKKFREAGLHIFRHKKGMLFVSSIRVRPFAHDEQAVSSQVNAILELIAGSPRIRRKEVADKLLADAGDDLEARRLALASDLKWLISEGYLIEFNDNALDLPRAKTKEVAVAADPQGEEQIENEPTPPGDGQDEKPATTHEAETAESAELNSPPANETTVPANESQGDISPVADVHPEEQEAS